MRFDFDASGDMNSVEFAFTIGVWPKSYYGWVFEMGGHFLFWGFMIVISGNEKKKNKKGKK